MSIEDENFVLYCLYCDSFGFCSCTHGICKCVNSEYFGKSVDWDNTCPCANREKPIF